MSGVWERITCVQGDITLEVVDAVVNAANESLRGGGGVDGAIHRAAGPALLAECIERHPDGCPTGEVRLTSGHDLSARHVIHAVGPRWRGGEHGEPELLAACYRNAVELAQAEGFVSLAFPAISCGIYGYPVESGAELSLGVLADVLERAPIVETVRMVLFSDELLAVWSRTHGALSSVA